MKNVKELLSFAIAFSQALIDSLEDKKIGILDFPKFITPIMSAASAFEEIQKCTEELKNMNAEQRAELIEFVQSKFNLENDAAEALIEQTIIHFADTYALAVRWISYQKPVIN